MLPTVFQCHFNTKFTSLINYMEQNLYREYDSCSASQKLFLSMKPNTYCRLQNNPQEIRILKQANVVQNLTYTCMYLWHLFLEAIL
jgi:hypothetical protein